MATVRTFEDLEVWRRARALAYRIFELSSKGLFSKDFALRNQIRDSSGSIMDNIAEGFERGGRKEFVQFLGFAKGSAGETRSQLYRAFDSMYLDDKEFKELVEDALAISKMLSALMRYLNGSTIKGSKFLEPLDEYHTDARSEANPQP
jgi:four helix bundle protein